MRLRGLRRGLADARVRRRDVVNRVGGARLAYGRRGREVRGVLRRGGYGRAPLRGRLGRLLEDVVFLRSLVLLRVRFIGVLAFFYGAEDACCVPLGKLDLLLCVFVGWAPDAGELEEGGCRVEGIGGLSEEWR